MWMMDVGSTWIDFFLSPKIHRAVSFPPSGFYGPPPHSLISPLTPSGLTYRACLFGGRRRQALKNNFKRRGTYIPALLHKQFIRRQNHDIVSLFPQAILTVFHKTHAKWLTEHLNAVEEEAEEVEVAEEDMVEEDMVEEEETQPNKNDRRRRIYSICQSIWIRVSMSSLVVDGKVCFIFHFLLDKPSKLKPLLVLCMGIGQKANWA